MAKRKKNSTHAALFEPQKAVDQAIKELIEATKADAILNALARIQWIKAHQTEPPQSAIPTVGKFLKYATGKEKDQDQIDLANFCFSEQWKRQYTGELKDGFVVAETAHFLRAWVTGERQIKVLTGHLKDRVLMLLSDIDIEIAHALWKKEST